jgi:hypothetical protein
MKYNNWFLLFICCLIFYPLYSTFFHHKSLIEENKFNLNLNLKQNENPLFLNMNKNVNLALIVPFSQNDISKIILWDKKQRCSSALFYYSNNEQALQQLKKRINENNDNGCIQYISANLNSDQDGYPKGINNMFFNIFYHPSLLNFTHFYWMFEQ